MSLYGMLFGGDKELGDVLAGVLGFESRSSFGRFRDCWVEQQGEDPVIAIYTRNGGGNRVCWETGDEYNRNEGCTCVGCTQVNILPSHPQYIRDEDDDFDCTYCTTWFSIPPDAKDELAKIARERPDIAGKWNALFEALGAAS